MTNIVITDLMPAGLNLFSDSENLIDSMQDLSQNELRMTFGGKHGKSLKGRKSSKRSRSSNGGGCGCLPCGGGNGGGGG